MPLTGGASVSAHTQRQWATSLRSDVYGGRGKERHCHGASQQRMMHAFVLNAMETRMTQALFFSYLCPGTADGHDQRAILKVQQLLIKNFLRNISCRTVKVMTFFFFQ